MDPDLLSACGTDPSWVCQEAFDLSNGNEGLARTADFLLATPLQILLILVVAWAANRLVRRSIRRFAERVAAGDRHSVLRSLRDRAPAVLAGDHNLRAAARAQTIAQVLRSVSTAAIAFVATLLVLGQLGIELGPLIAGAGIAGVAIGFGAQSLVKDFLSGVFMLIEDQYGVGDVIDAGEATGTVEEVSLRSTRLRDVNGTMWHIPNGEIRRVGNKSQQWARALLDVTVAYDTDLDHAEAVIKATADSLWQDPAWSSVVLEEPALWGIENLGADGIDIRLVLKTSPAEQWKVTRELRKRLKDALAGAGIEIPFPQRTLWVRGDLSALPPTASAAADAGPAAGTEPGDDETDGDETEGDETDGDDGGGAPTRKPARRSGSR